VTEGHLEVQRKGAKEDATEPDAVRFKLWLRKDVVLPAANLRRRLGIQEESRGGSAFDVIAGLCRPSSAAALICLRGGTSAAAAQALKRSPPAAAGGASPRCR
jgi:hypothetical protein